MCMHVWGFIFSCMFRVNALLASHIEDKLNRSTFDLTHIALLSKPGCMHHLTDITRVT